MAHRRRRAFLLALTAAVFALRQRKLTENRERLGRR
jgi:hypothetical protein